MSARRRPTTISTLPPNVTPLGQYAMARRVAEGRRRCSWLRHPTAIVVALILGFLFALACLGVDRLTGRL